MLVEFAAGFALGESFEAGLVGDGVGCDIVLAKCLEFPEIADGLEFGAGERGFRLDEHGIHDLIAGVVAQAQRDQGDDDIEDGVGRSDGLGVETVDEEVGHGGEARPAEPGLGEPEEGGEEQRL